MNGTRPEATGPRDTSTDEARSDGRDTHPIEPLPAEPQPAEPLDAHDDSASVAALGRDNIDRLFDPAALPEGTDPEQLLRTVYSDIHRLARNRQPSPGLSMRTTEIVNEVFLKFMKNGQVTCTNRNQFLALASKAIRQILADYARFKNRSKRRPPGMQVPLEEISNSFEERGLDLIALDEAIDRLAAVDEQAARIVELHFFGDLTFKEVASIIDVSLRTVERDWRMARAWLRKELG